MPQPGWQSKLPFSGACVPREAEKMSLRLKLAVSFLAVVLACGTLAALVGAHFITQGIIRQAQDNVRNDLDTARELYRERTERLADLVRFTALRFFLKDAIAGQDIDGLRRELAAVREAESLDVLTLTDAGGTVIVRARNASVYGDNQSKDRLVGRVLSEGEVVAGTLTVEREELLREGADLAERAHTRFVVTPKARPRDQTTETSGLMIKAGAPVWGRDGSLLGVLYGAVLLNRNHEIVDRVKETVYQDVKYKGKDIGTATIFQWDVRISTNVRTRDGGRALGTRLSEDVYREVLEEGRSWTGRAFVVNDWYITGYEPLKDIDSKTIGALYVGILEEKFTDLRKRAVATFFGIMLAGMVVTLTVSGALARGILRPIGRLVLASREWGEGNLDHRVGLVQTNEISQLANTFNAMAASLQDRDRRLKEHASQQIMKSEKLATLGQLAAGVAHEINNPLGGALMYTHLALENIGPDHPQRSNLEKATGELSRCRDIVRGLLDFARQTEPKIEEADVNVTLERTLALVENQPAFHNVQLVKELSPVLPKVPMDISQMQQVFANIILNAVEAMEQRGQLVVTTGADENERHVEIVFRDSGCGIQPEDLARVFEPFYTTKEVGRGTGLGLAISHGIVTRHKGSIEVSSGPGEGTTVIIKLPFKAKGCRNAR